MIRRSCLAGLALSYLPLLACTAVVVALAALGGAFRVAVWLLVAAVVGYAWLFVFWRASQGSQIQYRGVQATREGQPELMAVVDDVMQRAGIKHLDGVWLVPGANAQALHGRRDWRGRRHAGLAVGLLLAAHLSVAELAAALAHEAGHLTDSNRLRLALGQRREYARTKLGRRAAVPFWWFWKVFLSLTREQGLDIERHADAVAARLCGEETAGRAQHRVAEASVCHSIAIGRFVRPCWQQRISPATFFEAYEAVWTRLPHDVEAGIEGRMNAPSGPRDTHPGLAERCGGKRYPLPPSLRGDLPLAGLPELDRKCAASLRQEECRYPMTTMSWPEIRAERDRRRSEAKQAKQAKQAAEAEVTPASG
jgi:Zn-dependent protease with chaperone function